tara:strand:- start:4471 stop:6453 length:1983 start_codon:yes stop_codon:yes gene_type:complete
MSNLFKILPLEEHIGDTVAVPTVYRNYLLENGIIDTGELAANNATYPEFVGGRGARIKGHPGITSLAHSNDVTVWEGNGTKKNPYRIESLNCTHLVEETPSYQTTKPNGRIDDCCRRVGFVNHPCQFLCATSGIVHFEWDNVELPNGSNSPLRGIPAASAQLFNREDVPVSGWDFQSQKTIASKYLYRGADQSSDDGDPITILSSLQFSDQMRENNNTIVEGSGVINNPDSIFGIQTKDGFFTLYTGGYIDTSPSFFPVFSTIKDVRVWFESADGTDAVEFPDCPCGNIMFPAGVDDDASKGAYININNSKKHQLLHTENAGVNNGEELVSITKLSYTSPVFLNDISVDFGEFYKQEKNIINIFGPIYVEIRSKISDRIVARKYVNKAGDLYTINSGRIIFDCSEILVKFLYNTDTLILTVRSVCPDVEEVCCSPQQDARIIPQVNDLCVTDPCCYDLPTTVVFSAKSKTRLIVRSYGYSRTPFLDTMQVVTTEDLSDKVTGQLSDFYFTNDYSDVFHFNYRPIFYGPTTPFVALPDIQKSQTNPCETQELLSREITLCTDQYLPTNDFKDGTWIFRIDECPENLSLAVYSEVAGNTSWQVSVFNGAGVLLRTASGAATPVTGTFLPVVQCYGQDMPESSNGITVFDQDKDYSMKYERLI